MSDDRLHGAASDDRGDLRLAAVLAAAAAPAEAPLPGEAAALAAFRAAYPPAPAPRARHARRSSRARENLRLVAAAVFGGVVMASGVATAATGGGFFGVHQPKPAHAPAVHDQTGGDTSTDGTAPAGTQPATGTETGTDGTGAGSDTSRLATTTDSTGVDKGAEICTQASANGTHPDGACKAGQTHGRADTTTGTHGKPADPGSAGAERSKAGSHRQNDATTHGDTTHRDTTHRGGAHAVGTAVESGRGSTHSDGRNSVGLTHRR